MIYISFLYVAMKFIITGNDNIVCVVIVIIIVIIIAIMREIGDIMGVYRSATLLLSQRYLILCLSV